MAVYRSIHVSFWQDAFILDLTPEEKYFYLYLMTNSKTSQCGTYEIPKKVMELETGYNRETVDKLLQRFIDYKKIEYCEETKELMLTNWLKHNSYNSPKVLICIKKEVALIKCIDFKQCYMDSLSIVYVGIKKEKEQKQKEQKQKEKEQKENTVVPETAKEIIHYFNFVMKSNYRATGKATQSHINARIEEGYSIEDFKVVIDKKYEEWNNTDMAKYLCPDTLFGTKFEKYLNQPNAKPKGSSKKANPFDELLREELENEQNGNDSTDENNKRFLPTLL